MSFQVSISGHKLFDSAEDAGTFEGQVLDAVKKFVRELDSDTGGAVASASFMGNEIVQTDVLAQVREDAGEEPPGEQVPDQDDGERDTPEPLTGDGAVRESEGEREPGVTQT